MRFSIALIALTGAFTTASASLVGRQSTLPSCAVSCLTNADFGSCSQTDNVCLCKSQAFINSTTTCIEGACSGSDLANAEAYSQAVCKSVGVTLTSASPSSTATSPSSATSSSSAAAASPTASTGAAISTGVNAFAGAAAIGLGMIALAL